MCCAVRGSRLLHALVAVSLAAACGNEMRTTAPTPSLVLTFAEPVVARVVAAPSGVTAEPHLVTGFPVTIADPAGPGGTLASVTLVVRNVSRAMEAGRNVRPNADFAYPVTTIPPRGSLSVEAGISFPLSPPRDELEVAVSVALTDGRMVTRTARVVVGG